MEPMNLGSTPSSPSSPGTNPHFLPAFLMGGDKPYSPNITSSNQSRNDSYTAVSSPLETTGSLRSRLFAPDSPASVSSPRLDINVEKPGPPKQGLFDTLETKKTTSTGPFVTDSPSLHNISRTVPTHCLDENGLLNQNESFTSLGNIRELDINASLWVTVFGFPPSCGGVVLARLASCGTIVEKRFPTQGNWVHIKFSSPHETSKALALNGKLISNCIMIGVVLYQNKEANKENVSNRVFTSPIRCRPLRQSFTSSQDSNTVLPTQNVPQKSTGLVTKAMEYVFGW